MTCCARCAHFTFRHDGDAKLSRHGFGRCALEPAASYRSYLSRCEHHEPGRDERLIRWVEGQHRAFVAEIQAADERGPPDPSQSTPS